MDGRARQRTEGIRPDCGRHGAGGRTSNNQGGEQAEQQQWQQDDGGVQWGAKGRSTKGVQVDA